MSKHWRGLSKKELILLTFAVASGASLDMAAYCLRTLSSLEGFVPPGQRIHSVVAPEDRFNAGMALAACVLSRHLSKQKVAGFEKHVCSKVYKNWQDMKKAVAWAIDSGHFYINIEAIEAVNPELDEEEIGKLIQI